MSRGNVRIHRLEREGVHVRERVESVHRDLWLFLLLLLLRLLSLLGLLRTRTEQRSECCCRRAIEIGVDVLLERGTPTTRGRLAAEDAAPLGNEGSVHGREVSDATDAVCTAPEAAGAKAG